MPFKVRFDIYEPNKLAPCITTYDRKYAYAELNDLKGKPGMALTRMLHTVIPEELTKSEQYVYLVYQVRTLQRKYWNGGKQHDDLMASLAKEKELAQLELCFFHILAIQLAVVHYDRRRAVDEFPAFREPACDDAQSDGDRTEHQHRDHRLPPWLVQCGRQLCGNRSDGDARDVVEEFQLCDLFMSDDLCDQEQDHR